MAGNRRGALFLHASDKKEAMRDSQQPSRLNLKANKSSQNSEVMRRAQSTNPPPKNSSDEFAMRPCPRRPSTLPEMAYGNAHGGRRAPRRNSIAMTTFSVPPFSPNGSGGRRLSCKPNSNPTIKEKSSDTDPGLTSQQILAFREVFDLFDSNGGGTIDAEELEAALQSVDIHISKEEIVDVMKTIDKDGSGEIDFTEFLTLMTNTEKFLEIFAAKHDSGDIPKRANVKGRETVLFDALTQFMKSSALKQMDEIVGYYNTKYKRAQAPHVVMHYAAGARLIGLTEKQLAEHLKKIQMSNSGNNTNPYAQPLYNVFFTPRKKRKTKRQKKKKPIPNDTDPFERLRGTGKIRLKVCIPSLSETESASKSQNQSKSAGKRQTPTGESAISRAIDFKPKLAWTTSRVRSITKKLPAKNKELTTEDLPYIREKIQAATREYFIETAEKKHKENIQYLKSIGPEHIPSKTLRGNFHRCYRAYIAAGSRKMT